MEGASLANTSEITLVMVDDNADEIFLTRRQVRRDGIVNNFVSGVNVTGTNGVDACTLVVTGVSPPDFVWVGTGKPTFTGFTAAYTAHGFGASRIGSGLVVAPKATAPASSASPTSRTRSSRTTSSSS